MSSPVASAVIGAALLAAALTLPASAQAPSAAAPPSSAVAPLTVQGTPPPEMMEEWAQSFVRSYAKPTAKLGQLARWRDPVCVQVLGLTAEAAAPIAARVEDVARSLGLAVRPAGCTANIEIIFADQPQRLLDTVAARAETVLGFHYPLETKTLKTVNRPVQAWYKTATRGTGGPNVGMAFAILTNQAGQTLPNDGIPGVTVERETADTPDNRTPTGCGDSHFSSCLESVFRNVLVVVDDTRVNGQDLGLLSDYLALVALSQPRSLDGCAALPSVIDLYAPAACPGRMAPNGLSQADAAYLTALYATDPEAKKMAQQSDIVARMTKMLTGAPNKAGR
jgi:hypothetical protein